MAKQVVWLAAALAALVAPVLAADSGSQPRAYNPGAAQRVIDGSITQKEGQPPAVTLVAREAPALDVLETLDHLLSGTQILIPMRSFRKLESSNVTISLQEVPVDQAVSALAAKVGLQVQRTGDVYTLTSQALTTGRAAPERAKVSVQFKKTPLKTVIEMLQRASPTQSYVVDDEALASAPPITAAFNGVPLSTAIEAVARQANLRAVTSDGVVTFLKLNGPPSPVRSGGVSFGDQRITLQVKAMPFALVLDQIQKQVPGISFVIDGTMGSSARTITASFSEVRLSDVLNSIAKQARLRFQKVNGVYTVVPLEEAQPVTSEPPMSAKTGLSVEFRNAPLSVVLKQLSEASGGASFIIDDATVSAAGTVTGTFNNLDLDSILRAVATQTRTRIRKDHGVYTVTMRK